MSDNTDRLIDEIQIALGVPKELFQRCPHCGKHWGTCDHWENNPVKVDEETMRMIYEKLDMPIPVYPSNWSDFWDAVKISCLNMTKK